jgi:hypothetical protein
MANGNQFSGSQQIGLSLSGVDMAYGTTRSQRDFEKKRTGIKEYSNLESIVLELERLAKKAEKSYNKKKRKAGIGRMVGAIIGTAVGAATGNPALARAAMTAAGGAIGGRIGRGKDIKTQVSSQFVPGGIFYANTREELEMKAQDFRDAIGEMNQSFDKQLGVNFIFDMITGASFAKAGEFVPEGGSLTLNEMYQAGQISFKDLIKDSAMQLLPGGISDDRSEELGFLQKNESLTVSDMWVKPSDDPSTWTINEDLLTGWGRKNINFEDFNPMDSISEANRTFPTTSDYGKLFDPATAKPIKPLTAEDFYKTTDWMTDTGEVVATKAVDPLKKDLARVYKGNIGGDKFQTVIDEYQAAVANDIPVDSIEDYYKNYFGKSNISQKYRWNSETKKYEANVLPNFGQDMLTQYGDLDAMSKITSPYSEAMESILPGTTMPSGEATTVQAGVLPEDWNLMSSQDKELLIAENKNQINALYNTTTSPTPEITSPYGVANQPFVPSSPRTPSERGIIDTDAMYESRLSGQALYDYRAEKFDIDPTLLDPEFSIEAGRILVEDLGYKTAYADSTLEKAFSAFRKDNPDFKGKITNKTVPYDVMQPYIERFEAGEHGPGFINKGGDAGLMQISPDWYNMDGKWKTNKDGTPSQTWIKLHQLLQLHKNKNQGLFDLDFRLPQRAPGSSINSLYGGIG